MSTRGAIRFPDSMSPKSHTAHATPRRAVMSSNRRHLRTTRRILSLGIASHALSPLTIALPERYELKLAPPLVTAADRGGFTPAPGPSSSLPPVLCCGSLRLSQRLSTPLSPRYLCPRIAMSLSLLDALRLGGVLASGLNAGALCAFNLVAVEALRRENAMCVE